MSFYRTEGADDRGKEAPLSLRVSLKVVAPDARLAGAEPVGLAVCAASRVPRAGRGFVGPGAAPAGSAQPQSMECIEESCMTARNQVVAALYRSMLHEAFSIPEPAAPQGEASEAHLSKSISRTGDLADA